MTTTEHPSKSEQLTAADVQFVLAQAGRAPSIHNTQPWKFSWDGATFTLIADTARGLTVTDPDGRELVVSCGAALFNLRLAIRKLGRQGTLRLLPDPADPRMLARLTVTDAMPPTAGEDRMAEAILRRHTHRGDFDDRPISPELAVELQDAATSEGCELHYVNTPGQRAKVEHLTREAEETQSANDSAREELAAWTPAPGSPRRDGVPATAYPADGTTPHRAVATRDFDAGRDVGALDTTTQTAGLLAVLTTPEDLQRDWLRAGMGLAAVLTTAAVHWAFAALHSQVIEVAPLRAELRRELATPAYPQLVLQFGYASAAPTTPRRAVSDITV
jgi:hypothetical protein